MGLKMSKSLWIDGILGSQLRDTQGETLSVEGADISELEAGRGRWNDNHGKGFFNCIGRITAAKKIFKAEDCEDDRQRYYWEKVKTPYIYGKGYLFNDEDHPNAKAAAAVLRNIHKTDCPLKVKLSVEGGVVSRGIGDPSLLARTKIHSCAVTFVPANQATLVEPLNLEKSEMDTEADMTLIKSVMYLAETNVPSFRHIVRDASAERIEDNVNKIMAALGAEDALELKQALIKDSLESKIASNIARINQLVKFELLEKGKKELLGMYKPEHLEAGKEHVKWAQTLPKSNWKEWAVKNHANAPHAFTNDHKEAINHFAGINHPLVRDTQLSAKDSLEDGLAKLKANEAAYQEQHSQKKHLIRHNNEEKIIPTRANRGWFDLQTPYSEVEGSAMGHCGNIEGQERDTDNILSLRSEVTHRNEKLHEPHLTFIENNGWLGETKGRANSKPSKEYHHDIVQLLKDPRIRGIAGGGYESDNNFSFSDLSPEHQKEVRNANPNFIPDMRDYDKSLAPEAGLPFHHKHSIIDDPNLDPKYQEHFVNDTSVDAREGIARNPNLDPKHHERLVNDPNPDIRYTIARNPNLDPKYHERLVNDENDMVRRGIAINPKYQKTLKKSNTVNKALIAGYGGAGAPVSLTGGGVMQSESIELGPKQLSFITCDSCGKEQVYGKFQVKCRECGKAFSMAKLEKFFSLQKSKQNTPEQQAKIDEFMRRKAAGQSPHEVIGTGTKGHLPPQREGSFHLEGATTHGKIVTKGTSFENKKTGERGFASHAKQVTHHWAWDHKNKKWNHIRTSLEKPK